MLKKLKEGSHLKGIELICDDDADSGTGEIISIEGTSVNVCIHDSGQKNS